MEKQKFPTLTSHPAETNMGVLVDGRGPDARDPILVAAILDGVFALGQSVSKAE